ncbi:MAG: EF-hand domain-containing protein [Thalassotalea sp.]
MKNISLMKVSLFVVASFGCALVNANDFTASKLAEVKKEASSVAVNVIPVAFSTFDTDNNGALSKDEINAGGDEKLKLAFDHIDINQDGLLSEEEFKSAILK